MTGMTLDAAGTARYIGVCRKTLYNMLKNGRFDVPPIPNTRPRRWNIEDIDAWRDAK